MRILAIGDLHIKIENIPLIDRLEDELIKVIENTRLDLVVFLGDILHTHEKLHTTALNRAHALFKRIAGLGAPVYVLVGNHDYIQNDQFLTRNHWMNVLECINVVDKVVFHSGAGEFITLLPYVPVGRFEEALHTAAEWRESAAIFCHQEFLGAVMHNGHVSDKGDEWDLERPRVISGHIHGRQDLESGIHYTGAALPGADGRVILSLLDTKTDSIEEIPLYFPKQKRAQETIGSLLCKIDSGEFKFEDFRCVALDGSAAEFADFRKSEAFRALKKAGIKVDFNNKAKAATRRSTVTCETFSEYLYNQVVDREEPFLYSVYEKLVNERVIEPNDILMINKLKLL